MRLLIIAAVVFVIYASYLAFVGYTAITAGKNAMKPLARITSEIEQVVQ